ncbi:O-antigen ligase family protein [Peribacillus frigoritolerans]|uniref:O-antigen ligase family protein n=1 Tax=Peribacillus frigoritolerans TaxID=450367 RepID=UPI00215AACAF|nr:O-antigen ligase family protein [Peribacillus frigoritolerans]MCR8871009.1 O-antigen ligase family protein [Peribacillus frigoritolerans]
MHIEVKSNDKLGLILFYCILISLTPILISTILIPGFRSGILFTLSVGSMFFIQAILLLIYFISHAKIKLDRSLFLFAWIFMTSQAITLFVSSLTGIQINNFDLINVFVRFISILLFVCIPLQFSISKKGLDSFMYSILMLGLVACAYNMIVNFNGILSITNINNPYAVNFKSFFTNRNSFAQFLFFCIIANTYLYFSKKSFINWACYFILGLNLVVTLSRTVTASVCIFLLIFFMLYFRKKVLTQIFTLISVGFLLFIIYFNQKVSNFIVEMFIREDTGTSGRSAIWETGFQILDQSSFTVGIGYLTSTSLVASMGFPNQFHNFYIETLVGGGFIDLFLHLLIFIFVLNKVKTIYKNDRSTGTIYFSGFLGLLFYAFFESASFFSMGYVDSLFRIFFITIPLLYANSFNKGIISNEGKG